MRKLVTGSKRGGSAARDTQEARGGSAGRCRARVRVPRGGRQGGWDRSQTASRVLLRNLDLVPLPLKVVPFPVLEESSLLSLLSPILVMEIRDQGLGLRQRFRSQAAATVPWAFPDAQNLGRGHPTGSPRARLSAERPAAAPQ